jgi:hypothetical protein
MILFSIKRHKRYVFFALPPRVQLAFGADGRHGAEPGVERGAAVLQVVVVVVVVVPSVQRVVLVRKRVFFEFSL